MTVPQAPATAARPSRSIPCLFSFRTVEWRVDFAEQNPAGQRFSQFPKGLPPAAFVLITLGNPREKFWGRLLALDLRGATLCGILLDSFDDFIYQLRGQEPALPLTVFFPMHRVERIELDCNGGAVPSMLERFEQQSGADAKQIFRVESDEAAP
jgi:hypothetical protein